jgi:hypothetical protein
MDPDERLFTNAVTRIRRAMAFFSVAGAVAALVWGGWPWGGGFVCGALASYLNFRWLIQLVDALGAAAGPAPRRPRARFAILVGLRYLLLAAGGYVILKFSALSLPAALFGLFVSVAAVIVEILFELMYARI